VFQVDKFSKAWLDSLDYLQCILKKVQRYDLSPNIAAHSIPLVQARIANKPICIDSPFLTLSNIIKILERIELPFGNSPLVTAYIYHAQGPSIPVIIIKRLDLLELNKEVRT